MRQGARFSRAFLTGLLGAAVSLTLLARTQSRPEPPPQTYSTSTTAVLVDVAVRDRQGTPVTDLAAADFELYEDGVRQDISSVTLVSPGGGLDDLWRVLGWSDPPPVTPGSSGVADATISSPANVPTFAALLFDHLSPEAQALAHTGALAYLDGGRLEDFAGVFQINVTLETIQTYTNDRAKLRKALDKLGSHPTTRFNKNANRVGETARGETQHPSASATADAEERGPGTPLPGDVQADPGTFGDAQRREIIARRLTERMVRSYDAIATDQQGYATTNALLAVISSLSLVPGRKTIVFFADGFSIPANVQARFDSVIATANRANVSVYTVDAAGLRVHSNQTETADNINRLANDALDRNLQSTAQRPLTQSLETNEAALREDPSASLGILSDRTGGFLINNTNDLQRGFRQIDADRHFYYLVSYSPRKTDFDGEYRLISVKVPKHDVRIRARNGYVALRSPGGWPILSYEGPALAALDRSPLPMEIPVRAGFFSFPNAKAHGRVAVLIATDAKALTFATDQQKQVFRTDFTILARLKDENGEVVRKASQPYRLSGPVGQLDSAQKVDVLFFRQPDVPPGHYTLEYVVSDALNHKAGAGSAVVTVPHVKPREVAASSLIVVRRSERVPANERSADNPLLYGDLLLYPNLGEPLHKSTDKVLSFFIVVQPVVDGPTPAATLDLLQNGTTLVQLPVELAKPDAEGRIQYAAQLPLANVPPGKYELRVAITQGTERTAREATFTVID